MDSSIDEELQPSVRKGGRFVNPWVTWKMPTIRNGLYLLSTDKQCTIPAEKELAETLPVHPIRKELLDKPVGGGIQVTWLGHATVLIQMDGINILTDPLFSVRASPLSFMGPKRYRPSPCSVKELPTIHAVVISHNHYDHLDYPSVCQLNARFGHDLHWFVPMGLAGWMARSIGGRENVTELDWWQEKTHPNLPSIKFAFTPAQHWCKRGVFDDNKVLWGSWCILGPWNKFYFAGDSGYCAGFVQIGKKYGPFDLAAIPIGAYAPRWFMKGQHVDPEEAVQVHQDIKAKKSVAIHWGTYNLAYEPYMEPPQKLSAAMRENGLDVDDFFVLGHGETKHVGDTTAEMD